MPGGDSIRHTGYLVPVETVRYYNAEERKAAFEKLKNGGQQGRLAQKRLPQQNRGTAVRLQQKRTSRQNSGYTPVFGKPPKNVQMMPAMNRVNKY